MKTVNIQKPLLHLLKKDYEIDKYIHEDWVPYQGPVFFDTKWEDTQPKQKNFKPFMTFEEWLERKGFFEDE